MSSWLRDQVYRSCVRLRGCDCQTHKHFRSSRKQGWRQELSHWHFFDVQSGEERSESGNNKAMWYNVLYCFSKPRRRQAPWHDIQSGLCLEGSLDETVQVTQGRTRRVLLARCLWSSPLLYPHLTLWQQLREPDAMTDCVPSPVVGSGVIFYNKRKNVVWWCQSYHGWPESICPTWPGNFFFFFSIFMIGLLCVALAVL